MRTETSSSDGGRLGDVIDIISGAMDFIYLAEMASERLSREDGNAFATVLSAANNQLQHAKDAIAHIGGYDHED